MTTQLLAPSGLHTAPLVQNLLDHMDGHERNSLRDYSTYMRQSIALAADGWLLVEVADWNRFKVLLRRKDGLFQYQCSCPVFAAAAPKPCKHIIAAATAAISGRALGSDGSLIMSSATQLLRKAHANSRGRAIGGIAGDGSIRLLSIGGKAIAFEPLQLPWQPHFEALRNADRASDQTTPAWPPGRELIYVIDAKAILDGGGVVLETMTRDPKKAGGWRKPVAFAASTTSINRIEAEQDRDIVGRLVGSAPVRAYSHEEPSAKRTLNDVQAQSLLPILCRTGRCLLRHPGSKEIDPTPLQWDGPEPWNLMVDVVPNQATDRYHISGRLERGDEKMDLAQPVVLTAGGHVYLSDRIAPLNDFGAFAWVAMLRDRGEIRVPLQAQKQLLAELYRSPRLPRLNLPPELTVEEVTLEMQPRLRLTKTSPRPWVREEPKIRAEPSFDYGGTVVDGDTGSAVGILQPEQNRLIRRDSAAEARALARLTALGFRRTYDSDRREETLQVNSAHLPNVIRHLTAEKWLVEAEGKLYRQPGAFKIDVTSGIDWFDLTANIDFDGQSASLPQLLAAVRKGDHFVRLDDGTFGMLPEEWLKKYGGLAEIGAVEDDRMRFKRTQVGLLDALLASQPEATFDDVFRRTRDELRAFDGVAPEDPPATFEGDLRPYQRDALGWFGFLRKFGFGGCLADDMGLGKTVQVLALLEARRTGQAAALPAASPNGLPKSGAAKSSRSKSASLPAATEPRRPAMVVVPRSLVFNWKQEAAKFSPHLRVLDHTQPNRPKEIEAIGDYDLVVTTYGTLRRDVAYLKDVEFDYLILDEAQAVKNPVSESAKAVRLLQGAHRLVLTGTPVQNHLGDLWSLFDFLNPGMLGAVSAFSSAGTLTPDEDSRVVLSRALRPFILRRTKDQVAKDLPAKLEQTIYCEMEPPQRKLYDELKEHYRQTLLSKVQRDGMAKSKIQILEALLRLRQAACHPGLIDKARAGDPSAKLDMLLPRLAEAQDEGHKVLVFSQFTSFLSLLKKRLDKEKVVYEYLDGKTRDRQAKVERFQSDPDCKLFLISLKAGGVGLNLTAADYVFLLDPWWNPAIEAQAIDRTHRIGQTRQVFACRLITRETVEEKVLALQQSKRELADAIINADNSLIRTIRKEDLELLLT